MDRDADAQHCLFRAAAADCAQRLQVAGQGAQAQPESATQDVLPFIQSVANRPLQHLDIITGERVTFDAIAMAVLARFGSLRHLSIAFRKDQYWTQEEWMDWRSPELFAAFSAGCLPFLSDLTLQHLQLSAESVAAIAHAAPRLHTFSLKWSGLSRHPAVACAVLGGYCEDIAKVTIDVSWCHCWDYVSAADITAAYQSAVKAVGRSTKYKPFTQLRHLHMLMCWCTPPLVWHALLSLRKSAARLHSVARLTSNDPLTISALSYLPSLRSLSSDCLWPLSFATFMERRYRRSELYRYLATEEVVGRPYTGQLEGGPVFELTNQSKGAGLILLQPLSKLLAAYRQSLCKSKRALLARWAKGKYGEGDDWLRGTSHSMYDHNGDGGCPHPLGLHRRCDASWSERWDSDDELDNSGEE